MVQIVRKISTRKILDSLVYTGSRNATVTFGSIGEECLRKLWYGLHWVSPPEPISSNRKRTFDVGHAFENICIKQLTLIGVRVFKLNEDGTETDITGEEGKDFRQESIKGVTGHEKGKPDGRCIGVPEAPKTVHLLELKTAKNKKWDEVHKQGIEVANPIYYAQCQRLMKAMNLERTLFIMINKDSSEYHIERLYYDKAFAKDLERKEVFIITAQEPPDRAYPEGHYKCGYCTQKGVCWDKEDVLKSCRTCKHVDIEMGGKWTCTHRKQTEKERTYDLQIAGCQHWEKGFEL